MSNTCATPLTRLKDLMPDGYGEILMERCKLKSKQQVYNVVSKEKKGRIYSEALKLAAETKAAREAEEKLLKELVGNAG